MLVDDSKTILRSAQLFLSEKGCEVLTAENGFESLSIISKNRPDIIFMDIMMPKLDGYQTCALIKSNDEYADIPVVMLSSKHNLFDMARGRLSGSEQYLTKPFTHDDLMLAIIMQTQVENDDKEDELSPEFV
ncbi:MAG: response regulator [Thiotrichaceae bacterium]